MTACGAVCTCHPDCPMVCTFTSRHEGACDWWLGRDGENERARAHAANRTEREDR